MLPSRVAGQLHAGGKSVLIWSRPSGRAPASFLDACPGASFEVVNRDNVWDYVGA
jgi:hypothetical protein